MYERIRIYKSHCTIHDQYYILNTSKVMTILLEINHKALKYGNLKNKRSFEIELNRN